MFNITVCVIVQSHLTLQRHYWNDRLKYILIFEAVFVA